MRRNAERACVLLIRADPRAALWSEVVPGHDVATPASATTPPPAVVEQAELFAQWRSGPRGGR